jgi:hypothetical protein
MNSGNDLELTRISVASQAAMRSVLSRVCNRKGRAMTGREFAAAVEELIADAP